MLRSRALDNGYVQAEKLKDAIHVRAEANTNSKVVTNVYKNETYTIKKFDKTGEWIKVKKLKPVLVVGFQHSMRMLTLTWKQL